MEAYFQVPTRCGSRRVKAESFVARDHVSFEHTSKVPAGSVEVVCSLQVKQEHDGEEEEEEEEQEDADEQEDPVGRLSLLLNLMLLGFRG